ncbi:MAG: Crp/Fnr family transcriptional regulator [Sandaracinaceae bacterium]
MNVSPRLLAMMERIGPLEPEVWAQLAPMLVRRTLETREHFAAPGSVQTTVGLLESGRVRAYFTRPDGKHYNKYFFTGPDLIGDYASLLTGRPVEVPQQALTPCTVWVLSYASVLALEDRFPSLVQLQRRYAEGLYLKNEQRELELATLNATERYALLLERHPGIEVDVPLYEIAAYLGITPTQLSRIRSRFST